MFHALGTCRKYFEGASTLSAFEHGDYGVDLFFVISGFIIMLTAAQRESEWRLFLRRRLERIVPMYWLATLIMFALLSILYRGTPEAPSTGYLLFSMGYATWAYGKLPVVYPGWTLEYEMAFYLLVTAAMALPVRTWPSVLATLAACVCLGIAADLIGVTGPVVRFFTNPMYLEFALGILIGHVTLARRVPAASSFGLVVVFVLLWSGPWDEWRWRVLVAGLPASCAVLLASWIDRRGMPLSRPGRLLARLGDASYSIYLVQVFAISIGCKALAHAAPRLPVDAAILIVSLATLLVAYAVHVGVEKPVTRWFHRRNRSPPPRADRRTGDPSLTTVRRSSSSPRRERGRRPEWRDAFRCLSAGRPAAAVASRSSFHGANPPPERLCQTTPLAAVHRVPGQEEGQGRQKNRDDGQCEKVLSKGKSAQVLVAHAITSPARDGPDRPSDRVSRSGRTRCGSPRPPRPVIPSSRDVDPGRRWRTREDSNLWPLPSEGSALSS